MNIEEGYFQGTYNEEDLYRLMGLNNNPSNRELEAKILQLIDEYEKVDSNTGRDFLDFFSRIYGYFFEEDEEDEEYEEYEEDEVVEEVEVVKEVGIVKDVSENSITVASNVSLNPLLKRTIKRTVLIDSQYRDTLVFPTTTAFTFNLSEKLVDVVSLKLNSIEIPYTWYTIGDDFGSNFFYLKGKTVGIDQGNYDYQVSIEAGNYQSTEFESSINTSFVNNVFAVNPDVSFGVTGVYYNKINSKLTMKVDIKNVFNETNYNLVFNDFAEYSIDSSNVVSIPQLLGFKNEVYAPSNIKSSRSTVYRDNDYILTSNNNTITIYLYEGIISEGGHVSEYVSGSELNTIKVVSSLLGSHSMESIMSDLNNEMLLNAQLKSGSSSLELIDGRFVLSLVLNRKKVSNGMNLKSVVYFEEDLSSSVLPLWSGSTSLFQFDSSYNELNNVLSEVESKITTYSLGLNVIMKFSCQNAFYDIESNNKEIIVSGGIFTSTQYLAEVNNALNVLKEESIGKFVCSIDTNNNSVLPVISCSITNTIPYLNDDGSSNFELDLSNSILHTICNFPSKIVNSVTTSTFLLQSGGYTIDAVSNFYKVYSVGERNSLVPETLVLIDSPNSYFEYLENMFDAINDSFQKTLTNNVDMSKSYLSYSVSVESIITCTLNLEIESILKTDDYKLSLIDTTGDSWSVNLGFVDNSYNLSTSVGSNIGFVFGEKVFYSNEIELTNLNNSFVITPILDISGGVYTESKFHEIKKTLTLPVNVSYTKEAIVANINDLLLTDELTKGSYIDISGTITKVRLNVNKVFSGSDYSIVFFDNSFTRCNYGFPSSVENVKWDTTMGWVLGYRNLTEYSLKSSFITNNGTSTFYGDFTNQAYSVDASNVISLTGDTSISVNLYSYVMVVLDDYCQNHLNDGLVTITRRRDYDIQLPSYANRSTYKCNESSGTYSVGISDRVNNNNLTANQIYSANQISNNQAIQRSQNIYSAGKYIQDIFAVIPVKLGGLAPGQLFVEYGGSLQNQDRVYFGPVNLSKMTVKLLNDKGVVLNLNNANWSFSFIVEMLYNPYK